MQRKSAYEQARGELALALFDIEAILTSASDHPLVVERQGQNGVERGFRLKLHEKNPKAPLSPFFLNLRTRDNPKPGPLTLEIIDLAARCMRGLQMSRSLVFDAVCGVPRAGDPFAREFARLAGTSRLVMEKQEHEGKRRVASLKKPIPGGIRKVFLIDDLITGADSKREAIEVLRHEGIEITDVIVLVDREQGGRQELTTLDCKLHSVFTVSELLDLYVETDRMGFQLRDDIQRYLRAPRA